MIDQPLTLAFVLTPWTGEGSDEQPNRPQLADDHPLLSWQDVTGQPAVNIRPDPNLFQIKVTCTQDTLDKIETDPTYFVLWSIKL